jgi:alkylhydroperoxidase/carboxymuconolactone decarboxylase family protein YurZ
MVGKQTVSGAWRHNATVTIASARPIRVHRRTSGAHRTHPEDDHDVGPIRHGTRAGRRVARPTAGAAARTRRARERARVRRLATLHTFGDSWPRTRHLDTRTGSLISVAITAALGTREPLRGQLRIALNNGASKDEIVEPFIHLEAYAGAARAFDSYQVAAAVFAEQT